ncbi:hypothetical protein ETAC_02070 [Edwardsiella piscicida C07-087]|nr:hypothetical protein ETAC_02070 [Edwardsiella piscicida C07-087]
MSRQWAATSHKLPPIWRHSTNLLRNLSEVAVTLHYALAHLIITAYLSDIAIGKQGECLSLIIGHSIGQLAQLITSQHRQTGEQLMKRK